jgi:hypothetical protein
MQRTFYLSIPVLLALSAAAEVRPSSRKLTPLNQPKTRPASSRSGNTGLSVATPPQETAVNTVTKVTFLGPTSGWGFVKASGPYYSPQGKRLGALPAGTAFKYSDVKATSKNAVLVCTVRRGGAWEGPVLLDCTDVAAYEGAPETLDPQVVADLGAYFTLLGQVAERHARLADEALAANPHYESAKRAQQAYQDSVGKAASLEAQMNTLAGARKTKALDDLRAFKYEQVRLKAQADAEALAYKQWKDAHPADPAQAAADPQLRKLARDLQQAKAKVAELIPSGE